MATILLSAAGAAIGGSVGGTFLGLSSVAIGRFAGATLGRAIDQRVMGAGSEAVETGRVERFRLTGAGEGAPVAHVFGRMQLAGHVIWATQFAEAVTVSGGGKGAPAQPRTREYSYSVSLAIALCEGEISGVGRVWADGAEIAPGDLNMRVYRGTRDQLPDAKMEAVEGAGKVPAYRGTAYVVLEDLDLAQFGNRVPQFSFEVMRAAQPGLGDAQSDLAHGTRAVALLPGSGEYALATTPVTFDHGMGRAQFANVNSPSGRADFETSLDRMVDELPNCGSTSLIVSWFGDDLRSDHCTIRPKVEQAEHDGAEMPWQVAGLGRAAAEVVTRDAQDRPVYGGTPADASVLEAIAALKAAGQAVLYYPFILMDQAAENALPDPWSDAAHQPALPWRGRITLSQAPGREASPDGTAAADAEVAAFFGTAKAADFTISQDGVSYHGPQDWGYRRFILHQAALCAAAGGVDAFCIGSEMRGLTQIRGATGFPAVDALRALAADCRAILGAGVKIGYAADWSEYFGYNAPNGDRYFHLDPLWADDALDFIGIDNYMPLSDWRDEDGHEDATWGAIYNLDYLMANIEGGEGFDWYYHSPEARAAQLRTDITDGAHDEPWIWRFKDIAGWWRNSHHERIDGVRQSEPTDWVPQSKPIWFTEMGCPAVDKGTNEPNRFLDPKSSESALPHYSNGHRDEFIQMQYLRAMGLYWNDPGHNPVSNVYDAPMVDMSKAHVWAWDARPFPFFPGNAAFWGDAENYARGHWVTGRVSARSLASVVEEICHAAGQKNIDVSKLYGVVRGYSVGEVGDARAALQPLMLCYGFDAVERDGTLVFSMRDGMKNAAQPIGEAALSNDIDGQVERLRASEADLVGRVRLRFVQADANFDVIAQEAVLPDEATHAVATSEAALALTRAEGRQIVERWLSEARVGRDTLKLALPPSRLDLGPGDVLALEDGDAHELVRIDRMEIGESQLIEAVRIEPETYRPSDIEEDAVSLGDFVPPVPVFPLFLDLPLMRGTEVPQAPHIAVTSEPWPGAVALYSSGSDSNYALNRLIGARATVGVTRNALQPARPGIFDRGEGLIVELTSGGLETVEGEALLGGANLAAIGDGTSGGWELFQFRKAELVGEKTYLLSERLRGQLGSDAWMPPLWPAGAYFVLMNGVPEQIDLSPDQARLARHYRIGPARRGYDDPSYRHDVLAFDGVGLKPLSPCHLRAVRAGDGALDLSWVRRTRIGGDSWDGLDVPLGEEREGYLLKVVKDGTLLREAQSDSPDWSYDAAARAADGLSGAFEIHVAQISASFGAGAFARLSLTA
ncbi:glycoside hydrolase TIM-barrel-like domain-containing protein [Aquicoccus sp. G2-2]|uniref:baseplate multidomain protein megatron n=1 Tax=Aquicoccus sp. G2-2 TaxID=3092120 RepID=UPI002ADF4E60|nr:glycoside hydrolase TIM-barrel-like domain-containing protein [Aquicoccus sp. G2-2]MEA1112766.1 glycoside hydrolase TIM-barrel-like domain-containing protein [Aquicoccus sp. G2-2]